MNSVAGNFYNPRDKKISSDENKRGRSPLVHTQLANTMLSQEFLSFCINRTRWIDNKEQKISIISPWQSIFKRVSSVERAMSVRLVKAKRSL